jgi:hypothetical protein
MIDVDAPIQQFYTHAEKRTDTNTWSFQKYKSRM